MFKFVIVQLGFPVWEYLSENEEDVDYVFKVADGMGLKEFVLQIYYNNRLIESSKIKHV